MAEVDALAEMIEAEAATLGLALVRVKMLGGRSDPTLQVMAERPDTRQLTLEDCASLSRLISERLDALEAEAKDPIAGGYRLEVSSPGIDRPLTRIGDYDDWKGHDARISLAEKLNGRKQLTGALVGTEGEEIILDVPGQGETRLPFAAVQNAKLVMTDKLIAATAPLSAEGADSIRIEEGQD